MSSPEILKLKNLGGRLAELEGLGAQKTANEKLSAVSLAHVQEGAKIHIMSQLPCAKIIVSADNLAAQSLTKRLNSYPDIKAVYFPARDDVFALGKSGFDTARRRAEALSSFAAGRAQILVLSAEALIQWVPSVSLIQKFCLDIKTGSKLTPDAASDLLALAGYKKQESIGEEGEFAVRGDILDIYTVYGDAVRISFFDDEIESVKLIDPESMASRNEIGGIFISPANDILLDDESLEEARVNLKKEIDAIEEFKKNGGAESDITPRDTESGGESRFEAEENAKYFYATLKAGAEEQNALWAIPYFGDANVCVLSYLNQVKPSAVIIDEPKVVWEKLAILYKEFSGRLENFINAGMILPRHKDAVVPLQEIKRQLLTLKKVSFSSFNTANPFFEPKFSIEPKTRAVPKYYLEPAGITSDLKMFLWNKVRVLIAAGSVDGAKNIIKSLADNGVYSEYSEDGCAGGSILVSPLNIENGFLYPDSKLCVIGVSESVGKRRAQTSAAVKAAFAPPKAGDFVVHRIHGIGRCEGTTIMKSGEFEREFIVLKYQGGDTLYVATDQMDNLQKYVGEENPRLNKIGGKEFEREKEKVRKSVKKLAINLLELYAKREKQQGFKYSPDTVWQKEFEDNFEYDETPDQLKAIDDIKSDMENGRIMDRLLVGDVGFGKTEVAFRAMFKTALDSRQSALLAPTTILARQHYELLFERLKPFGIKCALLTRLQTEAENKRVLQGLADGTVTMVVATHKVLSDEVKFSDLGLLVLDEEQRFGVEHKEKLKDKYPLVNVLTLSATPIPRTLNMALSGVRDISLLETPPRGRLPVQTYVTEYSDALCVDAISRETARGGQTLMLLNDIDAHESFAARLNAALGGKVRIVTAHGQMAAGELEKRISAFYDKQYDVLISTTIIENGIDLPDANTLIVVDSERFGLSQLYQLRGRVGRRGVLAHAYFTVPPSRGVSANAEKRLRALLENTEIGSGFRVAMSDLSIRGAGSLLGAEQSGHIDHVGYEMYLELLDEAVEELKTGRPKKELKEVEIKIDASAYIREGYVAGRDKLRVYKKISAVASIAARDALIKELNEIYGTVELPLENLINISLIKNLAARQDVARVIINKNGAAINFNDADIFKNEALMAAVAKYSKQVVLTSSIPPSLIFDASGRTAEQKINAVLNFLTAADGASA